MGGHYDAIVIGAGAMGSAAAYYLACRQQRVLLLEQFELDHRNGGSYGPSCIIRYAYDRPHYIALMKAAYPLWQALEAEASETLYTRTGGIDFGDPRQPAFQRLERSMAAAGIPYEAFEATEARRQFPQFRFDDGMRVLYQQATGWLAASRCVRAHVRLAQAQGATLLERTPVSDIAVRNGSVAVQTRTETYTAGRLAIATGSWARPLLARQGVTLPLAVMPAQLGFFQPRARTLFDSARCPVFLGHLDGEWGQKPYGIPAHDGCGVKLTTLYGWDTVASPSDADRSPDPHWEARMRRFIRRYVPEANGPLRSTRRCRYAMTPDCDFAIDTLPQAPHVAFATGFSSHGFKFSTLVGKVLAELVTSGETEHDISPFRAARFGASATSP